MGEHQAMAQSKDTRFSKMRFLAQPVSGLRWVAFAYQNWLWFWLQNARGKRKCGIVRRLSLAPFGFLGEAHHVYEFGQNSRRGYLSDYKRLCTMKINGEARLILDDKRVFTELMGRVLSVPPILAQVDRGRLLGPPHDVDATLSLDDLLDASASGIVVKPHGGGRGRNIRVIQRKNDGSYVVNGTPSDREAVQAALMSADECIVNPRLVQSAWASALHPATINTLRILTGVDPDTHEPFVIRSVQRMGSSRSIPVDNFSEGGYCAPVNTETGELGPAATFPRTGALERVEAHPETGTRITGERIPNWSAIRDEILRACKCFPMLKYVGWDVVHTDEGFSVLEGNNHSDVDLLQVHGPLLAEDRVRRFYKGYKVI